MNDMTGRYVADLRIDIHGRREELFQAFHLAVYSDSWGVFGIVGA